MSLSRFYKKSQNFQPDTLLPKGITPNNQPVWGESIIKEIVIEELQNPSNIQNEVAPVAETIIEDPVEIPVEEIISTPPPPVEPEYDLEAIRNEAFISGVDRGRKEAEEDFENGIDTFLSICNELDKLRETILNNSIPQMKELVMDISEKIIRHSITEQEETILATIRDAIQLAVQSDEIQIQVNPEDLKCIELKKQEIVDSISGLENIVLQSDATIERGGCKLESTSCTVDATLSNQIKVIRDNVMADTPIAKPITE
jgi:flagellar assembly protein FliH